MIIQQKLMSIFQEHVFSEKKRLRPPNSQKNIFFQEHVCSGKKGACGHRTAKTKKKIKHISKVHMKMGSGQRALKNLVTWAIPGQVLTQGSLKAPFLIGLGKEL